MQTNTSQTLIIGGDQHHCLLIKFFYLFKYFPIFPSFHIYNVGKYYVFFYLESFGCWVKSNLLFLLLSCYQILFVLISFPMLFFFLKGLLISIVHIMCFWLH